MHIEHVGGETLRVATLRLVSIFGGYLEGGPDGERLREMLEREAAGGYVRWSDRVAFDASSRDVARTAPHVMCVARAMRDVGGATTVVWLTGAVDGRSVDDLLREGLADVPWDARHSTMPTGGPASGFDRDATTKDGVAVRLGTVELVFGPTTCDPPHAPGHAWSGGAVLLDLDGRVLRGPVVVPDGATLLRVFVTGPPSRPHPGDEWVSRAQVAALLRPGATPLMAAVRGAMARCVWRDAAVDVDDE